MGLTLAATAWAQPVRITWIGQSCFVIQTGDAGPVVITDPPSAAVGYQLPAIPADVVTISHNHSDHNNSAAIRGNFTRVDGRAGSAVVAVQPLARGANRYGAGIPAASPFGSGGGSWRTESRFRCCTLRLLRSISRCS